MNKLDEDIQRAYFRLLEYERQRLWIERLIHPENFNWAKKGSPPPITPTKIRRIEELANIGFGEGFYQRMLEGQENEKKIIEDLVQYHCLWPHFERINGIGKRLTGGFITAGGDIAVPGTVASFWKGMGLDVLPDGSVPRRIRGLKDVPRKVPALPFVTLIGEQIRIQILRSGGILKGFYDKWKIVYTEKYPDRPKMFNHKAALRMTQKILYACLWREWRLAHHLPAPDPYAFEVLKHSPYSLIRIEDLYDK